MKTDSLIKVLNLVVSSRTITSTELLNKPEHDLKLPELNTIIELLKQQGLVFTFQNDAETIIMPTNDGFKYVEHCRGNHF